jgi:molecular chaperone DnaK
MFGDNKSLGRFVLEGIPPAPRGMPQVEITLDVDANGILNVKAKDKSSGKEQSIRIEASSSLSKDDIERMKKEAELHADEDKQKQESVEVKNLAESLLYTAEKALKDNGDKISAEIKSDVEAKMSALKAVKDGTDIEAIKKATEELSEHLQKIGEEMSKQASQQSTAEANPTQESQTEKGASGESPNGAEGTVHDV